MQIAEILTYLDEHQIDYQFSGNKLHDITEVNTIENAQTHQFCYFSQPKLKPQLAFCHAGLIIASNKLAAFIEPFENQLLVANAHYVFAKVMQLLYPKNIPDLGQEKGSIISPRAQVASSVVVEAGAVIRDSVTIGENGWIQAGAVIAAKVKIGKNCVIGANAVIYEDCQLGDDVIIEAGAVIGGDGFGWANNAGQWHKIPQVGKVIIGNRVSVGKNTTVDRGAMNDTIIEDDVIVDNQVHIAHNVVIGQGSAIAGQTGFAGSTIIGKYNSIGGKSGFGGHLKTADGCFFKMMTGVTGDLKKPGQYSGFPAYETGAWQKNTVRLQHLDALVKQVKALQKQVDQLQAQQESAKD